MRELFEEGLGPSSLDPEEAVRQSTRTAQRKRFYARASMSGTPDGFAILLDDKTVRTPSRKQLVIPDREIATAIVAEWEAQRDVINPMTMPLTRLANSVIDAVVDRVEAVANDIAGYLASDLLFYRAGHPEALVAREAAHWDPVLFWAAETLGAHFILAEGIVHVRQPDEAIAAARAALPCDPWAVAALHLVTTLTGSALLGLALMRGRLAADQVWEAAHVDEDWNSEQWGVDAEVATRRSARLIDFRAAATVLAARGSGSVNERFTTPV
jgi:chaperone required for assembly of F1-ATPase